ncbi:uncharacterized protein KD926_011240 [Aspergillus affinis]|uniref:uncharacterized protein n=1 Tax=Aspergillus affinis TaxID=1070780 RepID=UPI0022FF249F|nr:uncharacterized protein KD926_011240 [Aspergillus affinis]KAI9038106.1 hypothetical protein KD926_011240 [Aspergillus affinis]
MIAIVIAYGLGTALITIFFCNPIEANWKYWLPKNCPSPKPFLFSVVIINTVLDVVILISPQPLVWRLQMGRKRKMLVSSLLMVGALACVMSVLRFVALLQIIQHDMPYSATKAQAWSLFELHTSIYCACMPMIPNLFRHWRGERLPDNSGMSGSSEIYVGRPRRTSMSILQDSTDGLYTNVELEDQRGLHDEAKGFSVRVQTDIQTQWEATSSRTQRESV